MTKQSADTQWIVLPRVRLWSQPAGLGALLAVPGGYLCWHMIAALDFREHWVLTICTILLILAFFAAFAQGIWYLLTPFHKVWVSREEVQLRLGSLVLRSIPVKEIRSVTSEVRTVLVHNKEQDLYQVKFYRYNAPSYEKPLWLDWSVDIEEQLKEILSETSFLF